MLHSPMFHEGAVARRAGLGVAVIAFALLAACSGRSDGGSFPGGGSKKPAPTGDGGDNACGDAVCDGEGGESCTTCEGDCPCGEAECGNAQCELELGETCAGCPADCASLPECKSGACGDGVLATSGEECDDDNGDSFDGCSALCKVEAGFSCTGQPSECGRAPMLFGDLLITEVMPNPNAVDDLVGEWVEIYNATADRLNLENVSIKNGAGDMVTIPAVVLVDPGDYFVFGNEADTTLNGGAPVDYEYVGFPLKDGGDKLGVYAGLVKIDEVTLGIGRTAPLPGRAVNLDPAQYSTFGNDSHEAWCPAPDGSTFGDGDHGTPGEANPTCPPPPVGHSFAWSGSVAIPDKDPVGGSATIAVSQPGCVVASLEVDVNISHTYQGDMEVRLTGPTGAVVLLHDNTGGSTDNLVGTYPVTLTIATGGTFAPFIGTDPNGTWTLTAVDTISIAAGTLNSWGIEVFCQ